MKARTQLNGNHAVPRNDEEVARLLDAKPPGWEYFLFASAMRAGVQKLASSYDDFTLGYAPRLGIMVPGDQFSDFLQSQLSELELMVEYLNKLLTKEVMEEAIGAPGIAGDPEKIFHAASRIIRLYSDMMSWAAYIRGHAMPSDERRIVNALAMFADQPVRELRDFVFRYASQVDELPEYQRRGERLEINETIRFDIPDAIMQDFSTKLSQYKRR
jgi:hypothetical protein